ncbi:MAG: DUF2961 domain-containing protein [Anaerolineales bacterium]|nr:DUF2961 domain-containing protein [Anaerolineales bacterium]
MMQIGNSSLTNIARLREGVSRERVSSWDKTGGNQDYWVLNPGETQTIFEKTGAGCIKHIWITLGCSEIHYARKIVLLAWWDGENDPSIACPIGDFFGIGHAIIKNFWSMPLQMSPENGKGFNCWFPMPFCEQVKISIMNETQSEVTLFFYVDYESYPSLDGGFGRFHTQWRRQNPTPGWGDDNRHFWIDKQYRDDIYGTSNLTAGKNYVILDAEGKGQYVGCHLDVDCFKLGKNRWWGEGDDMIFIDGLAFPPRLHGTGSEDYFNMAYCPTQEYCSPYHGITVNSGNTEWAWAGKNSVYRFHIEDPIYFEKSILVTIEHGHANNLTNDYSSTAYWYQCEPHKPFPELLPVSLRLPREYIHF